LHALPDLYWRNGSGIADITVASNKITVSRCPVIAKHSVIASRASSSCSPTSSNGDDVGGELYINLHRLRLMTPSLLNGQRPVLVRLEEARSMGSVLYGSPIGRTLTALEGERGSMGLQFGYGVGGSAGRGKGRGWFLRGIEGPLIREGLNEEREISVEEEKYVLSLTGASTATSVIMVMQLLCPWARVLIVEPCESLIPGGNRDDTYLVGFLCAGAS
jgi:hypothetical protein